MKRDIRIFLTIVAVPVAFSAGWFLTGGRESRASRSVARHRIPEVVYAGNPDDGGAELRVVFPDRPKESRRLFAYGRSASASFDPTGDWCAVSDLAGSSESYTRIFRRRGDLDYADVADISGDAWKFFRSRGNRLPEPGYDHAYVNPVAWIPGDRPLLLVSLTGHDGMGSSTDCWQCVYDPVAGRFLPEFAASDDKGVIVDEAVRRKYFKNGEPVIR